MGDLKWRERGLAMAVLVCSALLVGGCTTPGKRSNESAHCYDANGAFDPGKAKDAYIALMKRHGYPVFEGIREKLWVSDYGTGEFAKVGIGAVFFVNNEDHRYMLLEIFLLPNQMLPEHWHEATPKNPAKLEGWLVRHGLSHIVGEGEPNLGKDVVIPKCHMNGTATVMHETICGPGDFAKLNRATARHWQFAGPEGAIISEVANVHDGAGVRHSDPAIDKHFRGK
jgi:D-lyxose ketol-isomerase